MRQHAAEALLVAGLATYVPALLLALWWTAGAALSFVVALMR